MHSAVTRFAVLVAVASAPVLAAVAATSASSAAASASQVPSSTASAPAASASSAADACSGGSKFDYFGVNESCAEFGNQNVPGVLNTDYTWPSPSSIDYFMEDGMNAFRVPFLLERLAPPATGMAGAFDQTYLGDLQETVQYITGKGGYAIIEPHNFMIYNNATISSVDDFSAFWKNFAALFADNTNVIFDLMNEPHDIDASVVFDLMQAGVNAVRAAGATEQLVLVEGTSWTGAWTWTTSGNSDVFGALTDPNDNVAIEMHQYLDSDGSGSHEVCVSPTIGSERLQAATEWLKANNLRGLLGEIGAGSNADCISAVSDAMCYLQQQNGTWLGALWWAAGPWWGDYYQSIEPPNGPALASIYTEALLPFV
ncbi:glycoside hydrolase superfamily [Schizophyllum amplum]|uniref:cellulase n=1 Tax=Schizophyllum amplum TaxID=97359 RepID=A0A550CHE6_9AGAR|nr:glycoside hydrolase superfamily [Auriculariopsis ampla]